MYCDGCKNINICKHYDYFCKYPEIKIKSCEHRKAETTITTVTMDPNTLIAGEMKWPQRKDTVDNITFLRKDNVTHADFGDKKEEQEPPAQLNICPECDAKTYGDLLQCSKCGKTICESCGFFDDVDVTMTDNLEGVESLCSDCYEELHKDDPEEEAKDITIYDQITSMFNLSEEENELYLDTEEMEGDEQ